MVERITINTSQKQSLKDFSADVGGAKNKSWRTFRPDSTTYNSTHDACEHVNNVKTNKPVRNNDFRRFFVIGNKCINNPSSDVSFKGWGTKIIQSDFVHRCVKSASNNLLVFEQLFALGVAGLLRPLVVLATPGAEKRDKEYAAVQGFASGVVGSLFTIAIAKPLGYAYDAIVNSEAYKLKHAGSLIDKASAKNAGKYLPQLVISPLRAMLTVAFISPVIAFLFPRKPKGKKETPQGMGIHAYQDYMQFNSAQKAVFQAVIQGGHKS